jgi:adenine-specific DNA glycosylase
VWSQWTSSLLSLLLLLLPPDMPNLTELQLRQIPGIGPYTAAAIASIAFNDAAAAVDGNVIRVLSRLRAIKVSHG